MCVVWTEEATKDLIVNSNEILAKCVEVKTRHEEQVTIDFAFATVCRFDLLKGKYLPKRIFG
jgi:hypothetical protein